MKKLLVLSMVLMSFVSYGQEKTYVITKKANDVYDSKKYYSAIVFVKDNVIEFKELGNTIVYNIKRKQIVNDDITLCLVNNNDIESEFLISEKNKVIEHSKTYTRLGDKPQTNITYYYFSGNMNQQHRTSRPIISEKEGSFGAMAGATTMIGEVGSFINYSGGGWIEYKHIGIEYIMSASVTDDVMADDYVNGQAGKWIAGGSSKSYGVFYKQDNGLYYGGGVQTSWVLGLENVSKSYTYWNGRQNVTSTNMISQEINEKKTSPYVTIGYMKNLGDWFTFKGGVLISKFTSFNVGVGYSF
jgi:hypothetical protein